MTEFIAYILRKEATEEFRKMILEYPQFGYDVINLLLDQKEKQSHQMPASTRKRARVSGI